MTQSVCDKGKFSKMGILYVVLLDHIGFKVLQIYTNIALRWWDNIFLKHFTLEIPKKFHIFTDSKNINLSLWKMYPKQVKQENNFHVFHEKVRESVFSVYMGTRSTLLSKKYFKKNPCDTATLIVNLFNLTTPTAWSKMRENII